MSNRKRKGKPYRPIVTTSPIAFIRPMTRDEQAIKLAKFHTALHMLATHEQPGPDEWRDLSDAVNVVETLALECGDLVPDEVMPSVNAAIVGLAEAGNRAHRGQRMGLSGAGIQAVREVIDIYAQCQDALDADEMALAWRKTYRRLLAVWSGKKVPGREVIAV